jgi:hypothetical protein
MVIENDRKLFDGCCSLSQLSCLRGFGSILVGLLLGGLLALALVLGGRGGLGAPRKKGMTHKCEKAPSKDKIKMNMSSPIHANIQKLMPHEYATQH